MGRSYALKALEVALCALGGVSGVSLAMVNSEKSHRCGPD